MVLEAGQLIALLLVNLLDVISLENSFEIQ